MISKPSNILDVTTVLFTFPFILVDTFIKQTLFSTCFSLLAYGPSPLFLALHCSGLLTFFIYNYHYFLLKKIALCDV